VNGTGLRDEAVARELDALHSAARGDWRRGLKVVPHFVVSKLTGRSFMRMVSPSMLRHMYIPVSRAQGELLYLFTRALGARRVVEFGSSFGISTLYLATAVRDNGGGRVVSTEIEPAKCRAARASLDRAGLTGVAEVLEGDALDTLTTVDGPIDLVFLDGWKDLYLPVLELLTPKLRAGALILADNVDFPEVRPYLAHTRGDARFVSAPLPGSPVECTWFRGLEDSH
jgi:predicted O-methyltransferase YrrM